MDNNEEMSVERSLEIISKSIEQSRRDITRDMGTPFIMWGCLVTATGMVVGHLWQHTGTAAWNFLWFVMTIVGFCGQWFIAKKRPQRSSSFVGSVIGKIWLSFAILAITVPTLMTAVLVLTSNIFSVPSAAGQSYTIPITAIIILLLSLSTTITGFVVKNIYITVSGIACGIIGPAAALYLCGPYETLVMAGVAIVALIFPGLIIKRTK